MDKPRGLDGELTRRIIKVMSAVNARAYRATGGRVGSMMSGMGVRAILSAGRTIL